MTIQNKDFYTIQKLADKLQVNIINIYRYIRASRLKANKISKDFRIGRDEFNKFLDKTKTK